MRNSIRFDDQKANLLHAGGTGDCYRNSVETFEQRKGVCGEQAFLFIVLARYAGLDARFVIKRDYTNAISRVHDRLRSITIDHASRGGFDIRAPWWSYKELSDSEVEELYCQWNPQRQSAGHYSTRYYPPCPEQVPDYTCTEPPHDIHPLRSLAFVLGACLTIPGFLKEVQCMNLFEKQHPVICSTEGREYLNAAKQAAQQRYGIRGTNAVEKLQESFDEDGDQILDRFEAYKLYIQVMGEVEGGGNK